MFRATPASSWPSPSRGGRKWGCDRDPRLRSPTIPNLTSNKQPCQPNGSTSRFVPIMVKEHMNCRHLTVLLPCYDLEVLAAQAPGEQAGQIAGGLVGPLASGPDRGRRRAAPLGPGRFAARRAGRPPLRAAAVLRKPAAGRLDWRGRAGRGGGSSATGPRAARSSRRPWNCWGCKPPPPKRRRLPTASPLTFSHWASAASWPNCSCESSAAPAIWTSRASRPQVVAAATAACRGDDRCRPAGPASRPSICSARAWNTTVRASPDCST